MRNYILFSVLILFLISCNKEDNLTWTERRVVGSWQYDDVNFTERWKIGHEDITADYSGITLTFNDDFTMTSVNSLTGETLSGIWEINIVETYNSGTGSSAAGEQLIASLSNDLNGEVTQLIWEDFYVNKERIQTRHDDKEGYYTFRLEKL